MIRMISLQARNWHLRSLCPQCHLSFPSLSLPLLRLWPAPQVGLNNLFFHLLGRQSKTSLDSPSCVSSTMQPSRDSTTPVPSILNKHPIKACRLFPRIHFLRFFGESSKARGHKKEHFRIMFKQQAKLTVTLGFAENSGINFAPLSPPTDLNIKHTETSGDHCRAHASAWLIPVTRCLKYYIEKCRYVPLHRRLDSACWIAVSKPSNAEDNCANSAHGAVDFCIFCSMETQGPDINGCPSSLQIEPRYVVGSIRFKCQGART